MPFTWEVDVPRQTPNGIPYSEHVADYVMLSSGSEKIFVQRGGIYLNASEELHPSQAPDWFWDAYRRITPSTRKLVGLLLPEDKAQEAQSQVSRLIADFQSLPP